MRYLLLVYEDRRRLGAMPAAERAAFDLACRESDAALRASGYLSAAEALCGPAATVRYEGGAPHLGETPEAAGEELRAAVTISARDLNEALQVVLAMPQARVGTVEVWPVRDLPPDDEREVIV